MPRLRRWLRRLAIFLVLLVAALSLASLGYNAVTSSGERPVTALYPGPFVRAAGILVAYRAWGSAGTPIVLLGGFAEPTFVWNRVGPLLARDHRVVALDLPPFGYSERRGPYTLAGWDRLLQAVERRLGLRRPALVGHSLGAAVAVADALSHPGSASRIVLLDGDALAGGRAPGWATHLVVDPFYTTLYRLLTQSDWIFRKALHVAYGGHEPRFTHSGLEGWQRPFRVAGTKAAFRKLLGYGIQGFRLSDLRRVRTPASVVWGARDTVDDASAGRQAAAALRAPFVAIPGAGHLSMLIAPAAVARAVG